MQGELLSISDWIEDQYFITYLYSVYTLLFPYHLFYVLTPVFFSDHYGINLRAVILLSFCSHQRTVQTINSSHSSLTPCPRLFRLVIVTSEISSFMAALWIKVLTPNKTAARAYILSNTRFIREEAEHAKDGLKELKNVNEKQASTIPSRYKDGLPKKFGSLLDA